MVLSSGEKRKSNRKNWGNLRKSGIAWKALIFKEISAFLPINLAVREFFSNFALSELKNVCQPFCGWHTLSHSCEEASHITQQM